MALVLPFIFFLSFSTVAALLSALRTKNIVRQNKRMKSNPSNEGMMISNQNFNRSSLYSSWKRRNRLKGKSIGYIQLQYFGRWSCGNKPVSIAAIPVATCCFPKQVKLTSETRLMRHFIIPKFLSKYFSLFSMLSILSWLQKRLVLRKFP